ncbi:MAG: hypothetical protein ACK5MQ_04615 [Pikeienuella sp.]
MLFRKRAPNPREAEQAALEEILAAFLMGDDGRLAQRLQDYRRAAYDPYHPEDEAFPLRFMDGPVEPYGALRTDLKIALACAAEDDGSLNLIAETLSAKSCDGFYPRGVARRLTGAPLAEVGDGLRHVVTALSDEEDSAFRDAIEFGMAREDQVRLAAKAVAALGPHLTEDCFTGFGLLLLGAPDGVAALEILMREVMAERDRRRGGGGPAAPGLLAYVLPVIPACCARLNGRGAKLGPETARALALSRLIVG